MSNQSSIKTTLAADATLLTTATGGVYVWADTNRLGISRETVPAAYNSNGIIKPCLLIKGRGERPDGGFAEDAAQQVSTSEIVEIWFYEDTGYTNIETMRARVYKLLHGKQIASTGMFIVRWAGDPLVQMRDDAMGHISVERSDYEVRSVKS